MDREVVEKIWEVEAQMEKDIEYRELCAKRESMNQLFLDALENMTQEQEAAVLAFLGYLLEVHYKTVEYLVK